MHDDGLLDTGADQPEATIESIESEPLSSGRRTGDPVRVLLREKLEQRTSPRLAGIYWEAIRAVDDPTNGERVAIAGHLLRLLQEELSDDLPDFPKVKSPARLRDFFDWLEARWQKLLRNATGRDDEGRWSGAIDGALDRFLGELERRIENYKADYPRWKSEQHQVLGSLDADLARVPEITQKAVVELWVGFHDIFTKAAHHGSVDVMEFEEALKGFEDLLGDRLIPRTFAKRDRIAELVREAENRADS